jgi:hypothetical protein
VTTFDTGERRRAGDSRPVISELIDEPTVQAIAEDAWIALVGEDEILVPLPGELPADPLSSWVDVVGGNVKAALPGPSALSLPEVGNPPALRNPSDVVRIDVLWRGQPVSISVQGALPPLPVAHH